MRSLVLALLLLAAPAHAAVYFATGFDLGTQSDVGSDGQQFWSASSGTPSITSAFDTAASAANLYALEINPASGSAEYVVPAVWSAQSSLRVGGKLVVTNTGGPGCKREVVALVGSGGDWSGKAAILSLQHATTILGVDYYTLNAFYGSQTQTVCTGSTLNGKQCATRTDCPEANENEAECTASTLAASPIIAEGAAVQFTLTQDNGSGSTAGTVTVGLYEGTAGLTPAVYNRGSAARRVGKCAGGASSGNPCDVNGDCPSSTCTVTNVVAPTRVRLGASDTTACGIAYALDDVWVYDGTVRANVRFETLTPNGSGTTTAWNDGTNGATAYTEIDESPADNGTTYATEGTGTGSATADVTLSDIPKPSASPTPVAVVLSGHAQKNWSTSGRTVTWRFGEHDGTNTQTGTSYIINDSGDTVWTDDGASASYHPLPPQIFTNAPDGNAWTGKGLSTVDSLQMRLDRVAASNVGQELRITRAVAEVIVQQPDPPVPTVLPDRDQDGEDTVCFVGDSTWDNVDFQGALVANLTEPDNIYFYTRGASKLGDTLAEWTSLLEGASGTFLGLEVKRGTGGRTCDVVLVNHVTNIGFPASFTDPKLCDPDGNPSCAAQGIAQAGYCEDDGGADQGNACHCDGYLGNWRSNYADVVSPAEKYCVNAGDFKDLCGNEACNCVNDAGCARGGISSPTGTCSSTVCLPHAGGGGLLCAADAPVGGNVFTARSTYCMSGCLNAPGCPNGVCVRHHSLTAVQAGFRDLQAQADARPTPAPTPPIGGPPLVIYVAPPPGATLCWGETSRFAHGRYRSFLRQWTRAEGRPFIDLWARFYRECAGVMTSNCAGNPCTALEDTTLCYRDFVHHTYKGQVLVAAAMLTECLTNQGGTHNGDCEGGTCVAGLTGDACSTDADCSTWTCDLQ